MYYRRYYSVVYRVCPGQLQVDRVIGYVLIMIIFALGRCESACDTDQTRTTSTGCSGSIQSPRHPHPYPGGQDCSWVIQDKDCGIIQLLIDYLDIERLPGGRCADYIGIQDSGNLSTQICGSLNDLESRLLNVTQPVTIFFHSETGVGATGFSIRYHGLTERAKRADPAVYISSTQNYILPNHTYTGVVRVGALEYYIVLQFAEGLAPKCGISPVTVETEDGIYEQMCEVYSRIYTSFIDMHINNTLINTMYWGSTMKINLLPICHERIKMQPGAELFFLTPSYPLSPTIPCLCTWDILVESHVAVKISNTDQSKALPMCNESPLSVEIPNLNETHTLCLLKNFVVHDGSVKVIYRTPDTLKKAWIGKIQLHFMETYSTNSGENREDDYEILEKWSNILESVQHTSGQHAHNIDITWIIEVPSGTNILLTFHTFEFREPIGRLNGIDLCEDFIKIRDHASLLFYKCGWSNMVLSVLSSGPIMYVHFVSDISDAGLGFRAVYKALCRRVYIDHYEIVSPNYPNVLPSLSFKCKWLFRKANYTILVKLIADPDRSSHLVCGSSPLQVELTNYNYKPVELCSNKSEMIYKNFAAISYKYTYGTTEAWIGKISIRLVETINDDTCSWLCSNSNCKRADNELHVDTAPCVCVRSLDTKPCRNYSEVCSPEYCKRVLCGGGFNIVSEEMTFRSPSGKPRSDIWCKWTIQKSNHYVIFQTSFHENNKEHHPHCGLNMLRVEFEHERLAQELCSSTPAFMYSSEKRLIFHFRYSVQLIHGNFMGNISIRFVERLSNSDCVSACHQDSCKLYYYNNSISLAPRCVCSKNTFNRPCQKEVEICLSEQCVFEECWKKIQSLQVFIPPDVSPLPVEYTKCVWTIYKENHLVLFKHVDVSGKSSLGPACKASTVKILQNNNELTKLCKDNPVYVAVGQTELVYTHSTSWSVRVAVNVVPFPSDDSCDWLCSQKKCQVKIIDQANHFTCYCPNRFFNLSCEEHNDVCQAQECLDKQGSKEEMTVSTSGSSDTRDLNASRVKNETKKPEIFCKDDLSTLNSVALYWTKTGAFQKDVEDCPVSNSIVTRDCVVNESMPGRGQWNRPNVTSCVKTAIDEIHDVPVTSNSIAEIMRNLSHVISAFSEMTNEVTMSIGTILDICDILRKATSFKNTTTAEIENPTDVIKNFLKTVNFVSDSRSLKSLRYTNMESVDAVMGVVFQSTSAFLKQMLPSLKNVRVTHTNTPNFWFLEKNLDIRLKLWSNKNPFSDTNNNAMIDLKPADYLNKWDVGKPLWLYIGRYNNVIELMRMRDVQLNVQKITRRRSENETALENKGLQLNDVASVVVSVEFFNNSNFILSSPLVLVFSVKGTKASGTSFQCVFLQMTSQIIRSYWSGYGCVKTSENETHVVCHCHHVTNFAVLVDIFESQRSLASLHVTSLGLISYVGSILSILCCALLVILYFILDMHGERIRIHQQFAVSIIAVQTLFLVMVKVSEKYNDIPYAGCMTIAIALHYSVTAMFFWMLVEGAHMYVLLVVVFSTKTYFYKYLAVAWGCPFVIVAIALAVHRSSYLSDQLCWIHTNVLRLFLIPTLAIVVLINVIVLSQVIVIINKAESVYGKMNGNEQQLLKTGLKASVVLLPLLGLTWVFAFFIVSVETSPVLSHLFTYLFTITNSFQGVLLFIFHCLLSSEVRQSLGFYIKKKRLQSRSDVWYLKEATSPTGNKPVNSTRGSL